MLMRVVSDIVWASILTATSATKLVAYKNIRFNVVAS